MAVLFAQNIFSNRESLYIAICEFYTFFFQKKYNFPDLYYSGLSQQPHIMTILTMTWLCQPTLRVLCTYISVMSVSGNSSCRPLKWGFGENPMGSLHRGMQISKKNGMDGHYTLPYIKDQAIKYFQRTFSA